MLPERVHIKFISHENECEQLLQLIGQPMIGMDSEWRPVMSKYVTTRPALLQLSDETTAYLIDLVALANSPVLDSVLTKIFTHQESLCLGFSFRSDLEVF